LRVLIVDDDPATRAVLERGLQEELFRVEAVGDSDTAEQAARSGEFDAILLDVMLPGNDGFAVCRRLRTHGVDTPIMMLTGRQGLADRVRGLDAGADDYLGKPFAFPELVARLRALTRRGRTRQLDTQLSYGSITLDQRARVVRVNDEAVLLTATEFRLLEHLLRRAEGLVTRRELAEHVWGDEAPPQSNVIDVYVSYLRRKLGPAGHLLKTVRMAGYRLASDRP
jgi:DNA-binding response OmpR family regulator